MKPLRIYHTRSAWIWCRVDFVTDDQDWERDPELAAALDRFSIYMRATVQYRNSPERQSPDRFHVNAHPNIPRDIVFAEAMNFLSTLQKMYDL